MSLPYTGNVPISGQSLGQSRPLINANFQSINTIFGRNHFSFSSSNAGKHKCCVFPNISGSDIPTTGSSEIAIFAKAVPGGSSNLFWKRRSDNATHIQMTNTVGISANSDGYSFLPGGLMIQWGFETIVDSGTGTTVSFSPSFDGAPFIFVITASYSGSGTAAGVSYDPSTLLSSGVRAKLTTGSGSRACNWIAIGAK